MGYMAVVQPDGVIRMVETDGFSLEDFQREVGGWIGTASTRVSNMIAVVDDEGLLKGYTPNLTASLIANNVLVGNVVFGLTKGDEIVPFESKSDFEYLITEMLE